MNLWVRLHLKWNGRLIGVDLYGNSYYLEKKKSKTKKQRRFVLYKGAEEASKIPALWHSWLHYTTDDIPIENETLLTCETRHLPNLTGTPFANNPKKFHFTRDGHLKKPDYIAWNPTL
ncbi:MAG: NADH-ubiquinone oxidoreductase subunit NDUFA12 family protein [Pseudomonadota bacterium]